MAKLVEKFQQHRRLSAEKSKSGVCTLQSTRIKQCSSDSEVGSDSDSSINESNSLGNEDCKPEERRPTPPRSQLATLVSDEAEKEKLAASIIAKKKLDRQAMMEIAMKETQSLGDQFDSRKGAIINSKDPKYQAFKKELTDNSRMKVLVEEFHYSLAKASLNLASQQTPKELMQSMVDRMTITAWEKVQSCLEAAETAHYAKKEATEATRRAKELQTNCLREVTSLKDQLNKNRRVDFAKTPLAVWEPLDHLDAHTRSLVLSCVEEKFKDCLAVSMNNVLEQKDRELENLLAQTQSECDRVHEQLRRMEARYSEALEEIEGLRRRGEKSPRRRTAAASHASMPPDVAKAPEAKAAANSLLSGFACVGSAIHSAVQSNAVSRVGSTFPSRVGSRRTSFEHSHFYRRPSVDSIMSRRNSVAETRRLSTHSIASTVHTILVHENIRHSDGSDSDYRGTLESLPENPQAARDSQSDGTSSPFRSERTIDNLASFFPRDLFSQPVGNKHEAKKSLANNVFQKNVRKDGADLTFEEPRRCVPRQAAKRETIAVECSEFMLEERPEQESLHTNTPRSPDSARLVSHTQRARGALASGRAGIGWRSPQSLAQTAQEKKRVLLGVGAALERQIAAQKQGSPKSITRQQHSRESVSKRGRESPRILYSERDLCSSTPVEESPSRESCHSPSNRSVRSPIFALPTVTSGTYSPFDDLPRSPKTRIIMHSPWEELPTPKAR